jgi:hypothetical protein
LLTKEDGKVLHPYRVSPDLIGRDTGACGVNDFAISGNI